MTTKLCKDCKYAVRLLWMFGDYACAHPSCVSKSTGKAKEYCDVERIGSLGHCGDEGRNFVPKKAAPTEMKG